MPTLITDVFPSERPFWELDRRLAYHATNALGLLYGTNYDDKMEVGIDAIGVDDLPLVQPFLFTSDEAIFPGAPSAGHTAGSTPIRDEFVLTFLILTDRENGLVRRSPSVTDEIGAYGIREFVSRVKDAMETNPDSPTAKDSLLCGTLVEPMKFSVHENNVSELSWMVGLNVTMRVHPSCRGVRTDLS